MKTTFLLSLLFIGGLCQSIAQDKASETQTEGKQYVLLGPHLPKKILVIGIPITKTTKTPSRCFGYSKKTNLQGSIPKIVKYGKAPTDTINVTQLESNCFTDLKKAVKELSINQLRDSISKYETSISYKIGDISISSLSFPDLNKPVNLPIKNKQWNKNRSLELAFNSFMIPSTVTRINEDKTVEIITQGVSTLSEIAGNLIGLKGFAEEKKEICPEGTCECECAQNQLDVLRFMRTQLISGNSKLINLSEGTLDRMLKEIKESEESITALFTYETEKEVFTLSRELSIDDVKVKKYALLKTVMNKNKITDIKVHKLPQNAYTVERQLFDFADIAMAESSSYNLEIETDLKGQGLDPAATVTHGKDAIPYNIPAVSKIIVKKGDKIVTSKIMTIPQFGKVGYLEPAKKLTFEYDSEDGSLKKFSMESNAVSVDQIKSIGSSFGEISKLFDKPEPISEDEKKLQSQEKQFKQLEAERKNLEEKVKIEKAKKELGIKES